jgi:hypothetical protein
MNKNLDKTYQLARIKNQRNRRRFFSVGVQDGLTGRNQRFPHLEEYLDGYEQGKIRRQR